MKLYNQFVVNPDSFRNSNYYISPFSTEWISLNNEILQSDKKNNENVFSHLFGKHIFCESGREALYKALLCYRLEPQDEVLILTTSGNKYISSCVTGEIEKFCQWSRTQTDRTKLVLVVHEFGAVYPAMEEVLKLNLPIIEDMAMSLLSTDDFGQTGNYGDFTIYSLSKFFPVQFGGVLRMNKDQIYKEESQEIADYLRKILHYHIDHLSDIKKSRKKNYLLFEKELKPLGLKSRFLYTEKETPSVYMFSAPENFDLTGLKIFMQKNGVESSVFYGENAFFVPVHQHLKQEDILFITSLIKYYHDFQ